MKKATKKIDSLLNKLVDKEQEISKLPPLSSLDKAKLDNDIAIEHLYYSSKIEGTNLTTKNIEKAIHGETLSSSEE